VGFSTLQTVSEGFRQLSHSDADTPYLIDSMKLVIPGRRKAANPESSNLRQ